MAKPDLGTPETLARRLAVCHDARFSPDWPLQVLLGRGLITVEEHDAGMRFASLYYALYGAPFGRALDYDRLISGFDRDDIRTLAAPATDAVRRLWQERQFRLSCQALESVDARPVVVAMAVYLEPGWLVRDLAKGAPWRGRHQRQLLRLRGGLAVLANLPPARVSEGEAETARMEAAAS
ncbi:MAG: hypothetical protein U1F33_07050 [Alphaproteobacteria bacterium]